MIFQLLIIAISTLLSFILGLIVGAGLWAAASESAEKAFAEGQEEALTELKAMRVALEVCARECADNERWETADDDEEGEEWKGK